MCLGGGGELCPPTDRALHLSKFFKGALIGNVVLLIMALVSMADMTNVLWTAIGTAIGWCSIRNPEGFAFQQLFCYIFLFGIQTVFALVKVSLYLGGIDQIDPNASDAQKGVFHVALFLSLLVYVTGVTLAYKIYEELRAVLNSGAAQMVGNQGMPAPGGGGAPAGYQNSGGDSGYTPPGVGTGGAAGGADATSAGDAGGFKAFSGKGYRLV